MEKRTTVVVVVALVVAGLLLWAVLWAGVRATTLDRGYRTARTEACLTIEDDQTRAMCIIGARP